MDKITPIKLTPIPSSMTAGNTDIGRIDKTFKNVLSKAVDEINESQGKADSQIEQLAAGKVENVHQAMIALEEANIVLQFTSQVRNKVVEAYQEIMRMQV